MKPTVAKLPHGWFKGYMKQTDVIDTIESSIGRWDIVIVEPNGTIERERDSYKEQNEERLSHGK